MSSLKGVWKIRNRFRIFFFSEKTTMKKEEGYTVKVTTQNTPKVFGISRGKLYQEWTIIGTLCQYMQLIGPHWTNCTMLHYMEKYAYCICFENYCDDCRQQTFSCCESYQYYLVRNPITRY